jgi:hypothetical protein
MIYATLYRSRPRVLSRFSAKITWHKISETEFQGGRVVKKFKLGAAALAVVATMSSFAMPAMAEDEPLDMVTQGSLMVTRVGGIGAGVVIGTPVAVVRESFKSYVSFTQAAADKVGGKLGGKDNGPVCAVVSLATLPASLVVGGAKGVYYGTKNGVCTGFNQPFHPDSYSLGNLEE